MAIPMTTLEDRLQDEAWMNANKILIGFLYTVMSNKQLISAFISKKKKTHAFWFQNYVHCKTLTFHLLLCCIDPINLLLNRIHNSMRFIDYSLGAFVDSMAAFKIICKTNINKITVILLFSMYQIPIMQLNLMLFENTTGNTISNRAKFETINNTRTTRSKMDHPELH